MASGAHIDRVVRPAVGGRDPSEQHDQQLDHPHPDQHCAPPARNQPATVCPTQHCDGQRGLHRRQQQRRPEDHAESGRPQPAALQGPGRKHGGRVRSPQKTVSWTAVRCACVRMRTVVLTRGCVQLCVLLCERAWVCLGPHRQPADQLCGGGQRAERRHQPAAAQRPDRRPSPVVQPEPILFPRLRTRVAQHAAIWLRRQRRAAPIETASAARVRHSARIRRCEPTGPECAHTSAATCAGGGFDADAGSSHNCCGSERCHRV